jgi:multidrug resistance efflux pump
MIAFLTIIYTAIVVVLFKLKVLKPRPVPIAGCVVAGVLILGTVVVAWFLSAPMSSRVVTTQYVVQLVPYVKGQVLKVHAQANVPVKKGALLLEINPEPYQNTVDQVQAQLKSAQANVKQSQAGVESNQANVAIKKTGIVQAQAALDQARAAVGSAQAGVLKAKADDDLARTAEQIALNLQKADKGRRTKVRSAN